MNTAHILNALQQHMAGFRAIKDSLFSGSFFECLKAFGIEVLLAFGLLLGFFPAQV